MEALFQSVLTMSLSAGFLAAVVMGLRWFFKSSPKWVHCALWALVAVRLLVPALPQWSHSMVPDRVSDPEVIVQMVDQMPVFAPPPPAPEIVPQPEAPAEEAPIPLLQAEEAPVSAAIDWMGILAWVWLAGIGIMAAYGIISYLRLRKRVAASVDIGNRVFLCDYIDTPFILGLLRPRIYLPSWLDSETAGFVLAHELTHLQRRDHWWKPFGFALLSIHWFNPMIWAAYILLCRDIEMACDEAVIRTMDEAHKKGYSGALLRCSIPRRLVSICPLAFGEVSVKERIKSVLNYRKPALWLTLLGVAAVGAAAVFFLTDPASDGDVEFYQTGYYNSQADYLELTKYDREFREVKYSRYIGGILQHDCETSYNMVGGTQIRTEKYTVSPQCTYTLCPENGIDIPPGKAASLNYHETLDENGNVTKSICVYEGKQYTVEQNTFDREGRCISKETEREGGFDSQVTFSYDHQGNMLSRKVVNQRTPQSTIFENESRMTYDDQGNVTLSEFYENGILTNERKSVWNENGTMRSQVQTAKGQTDSIYSYSYDESGLVETCEISWPDGTVYQVKITTKDRYGNVLSQITRESGMEWAVYYNYIGSNGRKSIGIPKDIYTPGREITAHPFPEQSPRDRILLEALDVTPTGCILKVKIDPWAYSSDTFFQHKRFILERKNGEDWEALPQNYRTDLWDPQPLTDLPLIDGCYTADWGISWAKAYGILPAGTYRLTTSLSDSYYPDSSVEFTIAANTHDPAEERIEKCMEALNDLIQSETYQVEIVTSFGTRDGYYKSGMNYMHHIYNSETAHYPSGGELRYNGINYERIMGCWAFNEGAVSNDLMEWFEQFVFDHGDLELLRGGSKLGIPFAVAPRPGKELPQKDHRITFYLDENGKLTEIREEGVITEYNGETVETPYTNTLKVYPNGNPEGVSNPILNPGLDACNSFSWENDKLDKVGGRYIEGNRYENREPAEVETVLDVYRLARKELPEGLDVNRAMVARDRKAKMWRVEFRCMDNKGFYVYLDEEGITKLLKTDYPGGQSPEKVNAALVKCWAVLDRIQQADCYGIETTIDGYQEYELENATIYSWVRDGDWLQEIRLKDSASTRMFLEGTEYQSGDAELGQQYQQFSGGSQGDRGQFIPWLASCNWEDYTIQVLNDWGSRVQLSMEAKNPDSDSYYVRFYFDDQDGLRDLSIATFRDGLVVSNQYTTILTTDRNTVSQRLGTYAILTEE